MKAWKYKAESKVLHFLLLLLITWCTVLRLWVPFSRLWRWGTAQNSEITNSPGALHILLIRFASMTWSTTSDFRPSWPCLVIKFLTTRAKYLEPFCFCFCFYFTATNYVFKCFWFLPWCFSNSQRISSQIRSRFMFICMALKFLHRVKQCTTC